MTAVERLGDGNPLKTAIVGITVAEVARVISALGIIESVDLNAVLLQVHDAATVVADEWFAGLHAAAEELDKAWQQESDRWSIFSTRRCLQGDPRGHLHTGRSTHRAIGRPHASHCGSGLRRVGGPRQATPGRCHPAPDVQQCRLRVYLITEYDAQRDWWLACWPD